MFLGPAVELDVVLRPQVHWRDVPARRLAGERPVQLVDELPSGLVERFRDRTDLIAPGAHTVEGRDAAVAGRDEPGRTGGRDAGGTKRRSREVEVEIVDSEPDRPAGAEPLQQRGRILGHPGGGVRERRVDVVEDLAAPARLDHVSHHLRLLDADGVAGLPEDHGARRAVVVWRAYAAATFATLTASVVTLVKIGGSWTGPAAAAECQPTILIPCWAAARIAAASSCASTEPRTIPSGFKATAWLMAETLPATVPTPSMIFSFHPMAAAAL